MSDANLEDGNTNNTQVFELQKSDCNFKIVAPGFALVLTNICFKSYGEGIDLRTSER